MEENFENKLFQQIATGDEKAFEELFHTYWPQVYNTNIRLTKSHELALDLSQDIFIKIWENKHRFLDIKNEKGFIYTISRNVVLDFLRKKVFCEENTDNIIQYFVDHSDAQKQMEFKELKNLLNSAVNALPTKTREVFILSRKEGLTHKEIAEKLNISETSSKTYIVRALKEIRKYIDIYSNNKIISIVAYFTLLSVKNKL